MKLVQTSLIALLAVSLLAAAPASAASDLSVSVSGLPSTATRGQTITLTETITGPANQAVTLTNIVQYPNGKSYSYSAAVTLDASGQYVYRFSYTIDRSGPKGTYTLTVSATDASGTVSTSGTVVAQ